MTHSNFRAMLLIPLVAGTMGACGTAPNDATRPDLGKSAYSQSTPATNTAQTAFASNQDDSAAALDYALALLRDQEPERAALILSPFANNDQTPAVIKEKYAEIQLVLGNAVAAEQYAKKATAQDPQNALAYHVLAEALEMQGKNADAEKAYRKALEYWVGDKVPVMNRLALALASQKHLDEAIETLYEAKALAPEDMDVERNLRIVLALVQAKHGVIPKPERKPAKS
jgi:Flp pilus assembly protein TadD